MRVLVSGAGGLVGRELLRHLPSNGHSIQVLVRGEERKGFHWNPATGAIDSDAISGWCPDVVVHLAGENIASRRWSAAQKRKIRDSRVRATELLAHSLWSLKVVPPLFIGASAVGYYGNRGDELLTERSDPGEDFLAQLCQEWEAAAGPLKRGGIRVVHFRFGMILSRKGGALARMLPVFRKGFGGRLGSGKQWMSWISLRDVVRAIEWAIEHKAAQGAYNAVAPGAVTNREFTRSLAHALKRPAVLTISSFALRWIFGEMANGLLLSSQRASPRRLLEEGFTFELPTLGQALMEECA